MYKHHPLLPILCSNIGGSILRADDKYEYKQSVNSEGYYQVGFKINGKTCVFKAHRLIAETFLENTNNCPCVNHKDENKLNNDVDNLEWCSYSYNNSYGVGQLKRVNSLKGKPALNRRAVKCLNTGVVYESTTEAEKATGINNSYISRCARGLRRSTKGLRWIYI